MADISLRRTVPYESVDFFVKKYPLLLNNDELDRCQSEFASYQFENFDEISYDRMDSGWHQISQIKNISGQQKYVALPKLMLAILIIPHSNAVTERVFSIVRKSQTVSAQSGY